MKKNETTISMERNKIWSYEQIERTILESEFSGSVVTSWQHVVRIQDQVCELFRSMFPSHSRRDKVLCLYLWEISSYFLYNNTTRPSCNLQSQSHWLCIVFRVSNDMIRSTKNLPHQRWQQLFCFCSISESESVPACLPWFSRCQSRCRKYCHWLVSPC
jgi:hypothetical protein